MRIKFRNFRCYVDNEFDIPDTGLVLIAGVSGSGKSTILKGILYAFFGTQAVRKPYTFGTTTCSVELQIKEMIIRRTNKPNRLVVTKGDTKLEDAPAQEFIHAQLGLNYDQFRISSYIPQKKNESILSVAPTEQLRLIRGISFDTDDDLWQRYKDEIKKMIRDAVDAITKKETEIEILRDAISAITCVKPASPCPQELSTFHENHKRVLTNIDNTVQELTLLSTKIKECHYAIKIKDRVAELKTAIDQTTQKLAKVEELIDTDSPQQLAQVNAGIELVNAQAKHSELQAQHDSLQARETADLQAQIHALKTALWARRDRKTTEQLIADHASKLHLWKDYQTQQTKFVEVCKSINEQPTTKEQIIEKFSQDLKTISSEREQLVLESKTHACPKCKTGLQWKNDTLVATTTCKRLRQEDYVVEIAKRQKTEAKIQSALKQLYAINIPNNVDMTIDCAQLQASVDKLQQYIDRNKKREAELQALERASPSLALKGFQRDLADTARQITSLKSKSPMIDTLENLFELRKKLTDRVAKYTENVKHHTIIKNKLFNLQKELAGMPSVKDATDINVLYAQEKECQEQLQRFNEEKAYFSTIAPIIQEYEVYEQQKDRVKQLQDTEAAAKAVVGVLTKQHTGHLALKDKLHQAEILAVETTVASINEHTNYYLENFFSESAITMNLRVLSTKPTNKSVKGLQVITSIHYKGHEYDALPDLSGGEFDRCTLASICGINSMLNSPILILDESLASLDSDTNTEIIRFLSELARNKLILVCSHEAVRGIFDTIVDV